MKNEWKGGKLLAKWTWEDIKSEYITTDTSQRKLAKKYNVPMSNLKRRSKAENWVELREQYKSKVVAKTIEKTACRESSRLSKLMDTTSKAIDLVAKTFEDAQQFNRHIVERKEKYAFPSYQGEEGTEDGEVNTKDLLAEKSWSEEVVFSKVDTKALKDITTVLKDLTSLMRDFYNIPTPAQAEAQRIASERLDMDKRKNAVGEEDGDETGIIMMPSVLGGDEDE
jgi:hypothetical protein